MQIITHREEYRPKTAGLAKLHYGQYYTAERKGEDIFLPDTENSLLFEHKSLPLFLYANRDELYFGGTDERPFLVRINTRQWDVPKWLEFWNKDQFLEKLMPYNLRKLRQWFTQKPKRQGDIWALPLSNADWEMVISIGYVLGVSSKGKFSETEESGLNIYETRHKLFGEYWIFKQPEKYENGEGLVAKGTVKAPDHEDMDISSTLHLIFQNDYLYDRRNAD